MIKYFGKIPKLLTNYLSWQEISQQIEALDKLLNLKITKFNKAKIIIAPLKSKLEEIYEKMGDDRDVPAKELYDGLEALQKFNINPGNHTNQLMKKNNRMRKFIDGCIASLALLGVGFIIAGIEKNSGILKFFGGLYLFCAAIFLCVHRCFKRYWDTITPEVNDELNKALEGGLKKTILSEFQLLESTKKILINRSIFFTALQSTENFTEKLPQTFSNNFTEFMDDIYDTIKQSDLLASSTPMTTMVNYYYDLNQEKIKLRKSKKNETEEEEATKTFSL